MAIIIVLTCHINSCGTSWKFCELLFFSFGHSLCKIGYKIILCCILLSLCCWAFLFFCTLSAPRNVEKFYLDPVKIGLVWYGERSLHCKQKNHIQTWAESSGTNISEIFASFWRCSIRRPSLLRRRPWKELMGQGVESCVGFSYLFNFYFFPFFLTFCSFPSCSCSHWAGSLLVLFDPLLFEPVQLFNEHLDDSSTLFSRVVIFH